ncbi:MAG: creatininase family protein [Fimbriimonadales bacterium]
MRIVASNWMMVEEYLRHDDRAVVPLGCIEQHAYLSLATDALLAERVSLEAAEPLGVAVFPVLPYGMTATFRAYPGTMSLSMSTYSGILKDLLTNLSAQGFRRVIFVNGHGGNTPAQVAVEEFLNDHADLGMVALWHNWWAAPKVWSKVLEIDPSGTHANWMENFPWTRLSGVTMPQGSKPMVDGLSLRGLGAKKVREVLGDGSYGGPYERSDEDMLALWSVAVEETRALISPL